MRTLEALLEEHAFTADLEPRYRATLVGCATNVRFEPGELLARAGTPADSFFLVRHGRVALEIHAPGRGPIAFETITSGEVLGWSWLVPPYRWVFDARALVRTRAIAFDGACLRGRCEADRDLGYELLKRVAGVLSRRLAAARLQILDLYGAGEEERG